MPSFISPEMAVGLLFILGLALLISKRLKGKQITTLVISNVTLETFQLSIPRAQLPFTVWYKQSHLYKVVDGKVTYEESLSDLLERYPNVRYIYVVRTKDVRDSDYYLIWNIITGKQYHARRKCDYHEIKLNVASLP